MFLSAMHHCRSRIYFYVIIACANVYRAEMINCGKPQFSSMSFARSNGTVVVRGSWPWQLYIKALSQCGGVLISPSDVLTIAHCVTITINEQWAKLPTTEIQVFLGQHNQSDSQHESGWQSRTVKKVTVHPKFNPKTEYSDIAILTLDRPVEINQFVNLVCMTKQEADRNPQCYATGYGIKDETNKDSSVLRQLHAPYLEKRTCQMKWAEFSNETLDETKCCAGDLKKGALDSCEVDNGGPLVCKNRDRWELQGLVSFGSFNNCGKKRVPTGLYVNVPHFYEWIIGNIGNRIPTTTSEPGFCRSSGDILQKIELNRNEMEVICDGEWLVISRRRSDNSTQFFGQLQPELRWGDLSGDFWLGTDLLHQLTSKYKMELLVDIKLCDNRTTLQRKYKHFSVGDRQSGFKLNVDPDPNEDHREGLSGSQNQPIGCSDPLGRQHAFSCWWWSGNSAVSINDEVGCDIPPPINNFWFTWKPQRRLQIKTVEMKIRRMAELQRSSKQRPKRNTGNEHKVLKRRQVPSRSPAELLDPTVPLRHCQELYKFRGIRLNGIQLIKLDNGALKQVFCEMIDAGGGWTVIQRREDGNEKFDRNWAEYSNGFGDVTKDFWLGNTAIHLLTSTVEGTELRLEMTLCNGEKFVTKYKSFRVGTPESNFKLLAIEEFNYDGIGDWRYVGQTEGLVYNLGWEFSTAKDSSSNDCVNQMGGGGWWYNACATFVNVNAKFGCEQPYPSGNFYFWSAIRQKRDIKKVKMMIRPIDDSVVSNPGKVPLPPPEFPLVETFYSCAEIHSKEPSRPTGSFRLNVDGIPAFVHCDMTTAGGGWTTFMRRTDGKNRFSRDWIDYAEGFGSPTGDYWLGHRKHIHMSGWDLRIEITWCDDGSQSVFQYDRFGIEVGAKKFRLTVQAKSGSGPDPFSRASGNSFYAANWGISTPNCGNTHGGGGWWWSDKENCTDANLTGKFGCEVPFPKNMYWVTSRSPESIKKNNGKVKFRTIKTVEMKIRPPRGA